MLAVGVYSAAPRSTNANSALSGLREMELKSHKIPELLKLYADVVRELRSRGVVRSSNNPVADYAEWLFCHAFGWERMKNQSFKGIDAVQLERTYQIKSRRLTIENLVPQSGIMRDTDKKAFDFLSAAVFNEDFSLLRAAILPFDVYMKRRQYSKASKGWFVMVGADILHEPDVQDVTGKLTEVAARVDEILAAECAGSAVV
jgi:hypothetical protein